MRTRPTCTNTWGKSAGSAWISWLKRAITYYEAALQLSPNRVQFWNEWGTTHRLLGELDIAISKYEHALSLDPKFIDTYLLLGEAYRAARNWEAAQRVLREAVRQNPDSIDARAGLADAYAWADRVASAIREYEAVLDRAPLHRASYRNVILLHLKEGDCRQAAEKAQRAYALMPEASDIARLKDRVAVACGAQGTDR